VEIFKYKYLINISMPLQLDGAWFQAANRPINPKELQEIAYQAGICLLTLGDRALSDLASLPQRERLNLLYEIRQLGANYQG